MKILITGGGGLIGQAIAKRHLEAGDEVFIYDTFVNKYNDYTKLVGTVLPTAFYSIADALYDHEFDVVSHQAALVGVGQSQYNIRSYVDNNVSFTAELLEAVKNSKNKPRKILFAGSMGPYGNAIENAAVTEEYQKNPQSIYAVTKLAQEELIRVFAQTYKIPSISLRYFSVYGLNQGIDNPYTGVLSVIANMALNSRNIVLYDDGTQTRDLINVEDVAEAHFKACQYELKDGEYFDAFNIGTGVCVALQYVAERLRDIISPNSHIIFNGIHRAGDILHMKANIDKAKTELGWKPKHDIFDDIELFGDYVKENQAVLRGNSTVEKEQENIKERGLLNG